MSIDPAPKVVLLCNGVMARRTGTEIWVEENAKGLARRGWIPQILAGELGPLAEKLERAGIVCRRSPLTLPLKPNVILGSFTFEMLRALAAFPGVPAVWLQHDGRAVMQHPFHHPRMVAYAGVDDFCRQRIHESLQLSLENIDWLPNRVDLDHFKSRITPLPPQASRAAIFSNQARPGRSIETIRTACELQGLKLDVWGEQSGRLLNDPAAELPNYDLVFAKARCALEALACGCSVILCDELGGLGPMVSSKDWPRLRRWNLGQRVLGEDITVANLVTRIKHYDAMDAKAVTRIVREECGLEAGISELDHWLQRASARSVRLSPEEELSAFTSALEGLAPMAAHVQKLEIATYVRWPDGAPLTLLKTLHRWHHRMRPMLRRLTHRKG